MDNKKKIISLSILILLLILGMVYYYFRIKNTDKHNLKREAEQNLNANLNNIGSGLSTCEEQYQRLIDVNKFDFYKYCLPPEKDWSLGNDVVVTNKTEKVRKKINLVLIFDASGSMKSKINGKQKIDMAKKAANDFINEIGNDDDVNVSVIAYGHKGTNSEADKATSCSSTEEIFPLSKINPQLINKKINSLNARGWTPIDGAIKKAKSILETKPNDENFILLISDGKEKCGGTPVLTIKELSENEKIKVIIDVIGFDVGNEDENQLALIAEAGKGQYLSARNALGLQRAFEKRKQKLDELNYDSESMAEKVYNLSSSINDYNNCKIALEEERALMKIDINSRMLAGNDCIYEANEFYDSRYEKILNRIEQIFIENKIKYKIK